MIQVDHVGVPARARLDAAGFLARVFDLDRQILDDGRFAPVRVSSEFTIDFFDSEHVDPMHVAFVADDAAFDGILGRLQSDGIPYGSQPNDPTNARIDHPLAERGLYFQTPDGHLFEVMASPSASDRT